MVLAHRHLSMDKQAWSYMMSGVTSSWYPLPLDSSTLLISPSAPDVLMVAQTFKRMEKLCFNSKSNYGFSIKITKYGLVL